MTIEDTGKIMRVLKANYRNWDADRDTMLLWAQMFQDEPIEVVASAVKAFISTDTKGFAPVIGQIKSIIAKAQANDMGELEAWDRIYGAISNGKYGAVEEFEALPPILQKIVGSPRQINLWANTPDDELSTVVASNVMRAYRAELERAKFERSLPSDVREVLTGGVVQLLGGSV